MMIRELQPHEFTERLEPIFRHCEKEAGRTDGNPAHLFPQWRKWMELGLARAYESEGCILGLLISPDIFSGNIRAFVNFWFALPSARGTGRPIGLLDFAEAEARRYGCVKISSAAYSALTPERTGNRYKKRGYYVSEIIWTKDLT